eukprot:TRINITY_DN15057_c0_g1_i1.p1 TRINITY_DN15057_c0_g1~~TRINITY_DN15057_c0_g1_i1.p1  ORF type:complete len:554 (+),score=152.61 TRINITY_DN15057_c0_g1_i1:122-1783(+)
MVDLGKTQEGRKKVIIIGAGVGGSAVAARLSQAGLDVTVVEKNDFSGGRCSLIHSDGHRFDRGPSLYLMPRVFEETFRDLGYKVEDWFQLKKCDPNYKVHFHDGEMIELSCDLAKMKDVVEKYEGPAGYDRFLSFVKESHGHYETAVNMVLRRNFETLKDMITPSNGLEAFRLHVLDKVYNRACRYFWTDRLRRAFTFQSMYMGMSPYDAPATYNLLQYTEIAEGIWYPIGGFNKVVQSLEKIAEKNGAKFIYSAPVKSINVESPTSSKTTGVTLESGETLEADLVVCNADLIYAYGNLLPKSPYSTTLDEKNLTSSSISFYWNMKQIVPGLDAHNIFLAEKYQDSFDDIFKRFQLPSDPSFYVNVPSRLDPSAAPEGKDTIVVLVPVGYMNPKVKQDYNEMVKVARRRIIQILSQRLNINNFEDLIGKERVSAPEDWKRDFNLHRGSILGLSHDILQVLWFRPSTRHQVHKNLYFVGASTQPGTGVPIVLCGAKLVGTQILNDLGVSVPSSWALPTKVIKSPLDVLHPRSILQNYFAIIIVLLAILFYFLFM